MSTLGLQSMLSSCYDLKIVTKLKESFCGAFSEGKYTSMHMTGSSRTLFIYDEHAQRVIRNHSPNHPFSSSVRFSVIFFLLQTTHNLFVPILRHDNPLSPFLLFPAPKNMLGV